MSKKENIPASYLATLQIVPEKEIEEDKILQDMSDILEKHGYWCFGLIALTEDIDDPISGRLDFKKSFAKHVNKLSNLFKSI